MLAAVACGGAVGACARYAVVVGMGRLAPDFPYGVLTANVLGSFAMGAIVALSAAKLDVPPELRALLTVGLLGAFTTFSTFALDAVTLVERDRTTAAALYVVLSVALSIGAVVGGLRLGRAFAG